MMSVLFSLVAAAVPQTSPAAARSPQDVVVIAPPDVDVVPDTVIAAPQTPPGASVVDLKSKYAKAQMFARCAVTLSARQARAVLDLPPNSPRAKAAQEELETSAMGCLPDRPMLSRSVLPQSYDNAAGDQKLTEFAGDRWSTPDVTVYRRGAVLDEVFRRFVPDLKLTRADVSDAMVRTRFYTREGPRNALRVPEDRRFFSVAACMVEAQPELAVRFVQSKVGSRNERAIAAAIVNRARSCIGNPKRLIVQPIELRIYILDATYRWAVAARGVDTLIPDTAAE